MFEEGPAQPEIKTETRDLLERLRRHRDAILAQVRRAIVGQDEAVSLVMLSLLVGGHSLITGMPGMAKTMLVRNVARALGLSFRRIQFTPDLMPADITGTDVIEEDMTTGHRTWTFSPGPIFAQVVLADEINRTPPKTQAALLEAMQEGSVTVRGKTYPLEKPFFVLATQNPIELEGTYPLPEAQLDRFLFNIVIDYLGEEEELQVVLSTTGEVQAEAEAVTTAQDLLSFQNLVRRIPLAESVGRYAVNLVRASRPSRNDAGLEFVNKYTSYGASVRAAQFLALAGKARALLEGRYNVSCEDIRALARPVMRHRVLTNFHAESDRVTADMLIARLLEAVPPPRSEL
jgi:MoxR-like ATPase